MPVSLFPPTSSVKTLSSFSEFVAVLARDFFSSRIRGFCDPVVFVVAAIAQRVYLHLKECLCCAMGSTVINSLSAR